ncbi:MAG TPA: RNA polymerase sigma-54 factor, partial [Sphingomicrobium sp.]
MGLGPRLDIRQTQALVMTPQLQQAIKLLALSNLELEAVIAEELAKNPLLEAQGGGEEDGGDADAAPVTYDEDSDSEESYDAPDDPGTDELITGHDAR